MPPNTTRDYYPTSANQKYSNAYIYWSLVWGTQSSHFVRKLWVWCGPQPRQMRINNWRFWICIPSWPGSIVYLRQTRYPHARHVKFLGSYRDDKVIIFQGNRSDDWLHNWLKYFQKEVDWLLGTVDIQLTMEIWRPDLTTKALKGSEIIVPWIGSFNRININGNTSFPYLDIQLSWTEAGKLRFNVYKKPGELIKYLNTDRHHHTNHSKMAVLQGVELPLALLTTVSDENKNLSLSEIYPDKHEALSIAGQIQTSEKMRTFCEVLNDNSWSGPTRLEKRSRAIDKRDSLFIVKYANLGWSNRPINQMICSMRNEFNLKWLCPRVIHSRHSNLQEKLLGDLKHKLLLGITDTDLGCHPYTNCPKITKWTGYALTAEMAIPAKLPEQCTKLLVKLMAATASILGNHNNTSRNDFRSTWVR